MRNYHIVLASGEERNLKASGYTVAEGVLSFLNEADSTIISYASGTWLYVEVERLDDKGYPGDDVEIEPQ